MVFYGLVIDALSLARAIKEFPFQGYESMSLCYMKGIFGLQQT